MKIKIIKVIMFLTVAFVVAGVFGCLNYSAKADSIDDIQDDIKKLQKNLEKETANLNLLNSQKYKNQTQIDSTQALLKKLQADIARREAELNNLNDRSELNKKLLAEYVRQMYYVDQDNSIVFPAILDGDIRDMAINFDNMAGIKSKISNILKEIEDAKGETEEAKALLASQKQNNQKTLEKQKVQQAEIVDDIQETQATLAEIQQKMAELKSNLNKILGKSYDTGEIKDAIKFANKVTGVRKGFLFGVLKYESGGNPNAGRCTYKNCGMSSARKDYFNKICKELDFDCKKKPLSCASKNYAGSGGAMGAAQFMPDTWWGYKSRIASATGHNPPDPWNLVDGVVAMALKLENDGATKSGKVQIKNPCNGKKVDVKWEVYASMRYLGWTCYGYTNYAPGIQALAGGYDKL